MFTKIIAPLAIVATASALGEPTWIKAANTGVCAGGFPTCANTEECTYTAVGPCTDAETKPKWHLATNFVGLAFVANGYTADFSTLAKVIEPKAASKGFRKAEDQVTLNTTQMPPNGAKYSYAMAANMFGPTDKAFGYAGLAHYLNTGTNDISIARNDFYGFSDFTALDGTIGAPKKYPICITKPVNEKCTEKVTFKPGAYKFSLYGNNLGADWASTIAGFSTAGNTKTHMAFRMKVQATGIAFDKVTLNGNIDIKDIGETDVTSISISNADEELKYAFPKNFNYGKFSTYTEKTPDKGVQSGSIKIVVSLEGPNALFIDYLFPMDKVGTTGDQYFVYDPEISAGKAAPAPPGPAPPGPGPAPASAPSGAGQLAASGFVAVVVAAVSQLF